MAQCLNKIDEIRDLVNSARCFTNARIRYKNLLKKNLINSSLAFIQKKTEISDNKKALSNSLITNKVLNKDYKEQESILQMNKLLRINENEIFKAKIKAIQMNYVKDYMKNSSTVISPFINKLKSLTDFKNKQSSQNFNTTFATLDWISNPVVRIENHKNIISRNARKKRQNERVFKKDLLSNILEQDKVNLKQIQRSKI